MPTHNYNSINKVCQTNAVAIELTTGSDKLSYVSNIAPFVAVSDNQIYHELTMMDVLSCTSGDFKICSRIHAIVPKDRPKCTSALFFHQLDFIKSLCEFELISKESHSHAMIHLDANRYFIGHTSSRKWTQSCDRLPPTEI